MWNELGFHRYRGTTSTALEIKYHGDETNLTAGYGIVNQYQRAGYQNEVDLYLRISTDPQRPDHHRRYLQ